jgi:BON domain
MRRVVFLAVLTATLLPATTGLAETKAEKQVAQQIGSHLKQSGELQNYRVGAKYHDGVAYLSGSVASAEQRDIALRLAQQVDGVAHVVCKLEFPKQDEAADAVPEANGGVDREEPNSSLDKASFEGGQNDAPSVTHAYQPTDQAQAAPIQQNPMMQRQAMRPMASQGRRSNMPVPAGRMPGIMPISQGNPSGVCQTGATCPCNSGGGMGMHGGAGMGMGMGMGGGGMGMGGPAPSGFVPAGHGRGPNYDSPQMPGYAWPSYASYPNYAALSYPQQYSPTAWPYIGPFYPYPQVPLAWRKVSLEWDDGWWFLDFSSHNSSH